MKQVVIVCGHGPGISDAVARRFGTEGHPVALVARNAARLDSATRALGAAGVTAGSFPCDLGDPDAVRAMIRAVRQSLGPVGVVHWNAYSSAAGDLTSATAEEIRSVLDVSVVGLIAAVQEALPDLRSNAGAVLVTGGGYAFYDPRVDAAATGWKAMGLAVGKAAQHKTVGLLHHCLSGEGVYVGEVVVLGAVKGTPFDAGNASIEPSAVADRFWRMAQLRKEASVQFA